MNRKILCVCSGNTCRSPMMQAILQHSLKKLGVNGVSIESAGTIKESTSQRINEHAALELRKRGFSLEQHMSRYVSNIGELTVFSLVLCAGLEQATEVRALCPEIADRIQIVNAESGGIPDPWGQGPEAYEKCASMIEAAMDKISRTLK